MARRMEWMDSLRGIAIVLVLIWHAPAIPALLGFDMPEWIRIANDFLIPFRMPTLMFLSGLLLVRSLEKPKRAYYLGKLQMIAWPYLVWALIHNVTFEAVAPLYHPRAWIATGYLWFLFFILCYYLVAPLITWIPPIVTPIACFVLALILPHDTLPERMLYFAGFFFSGYLAAVRRRDFDLLMESRAVAVIGGFGALCLGVWSATHDIQFRAEFAILSLGGILAAIHVMSRVGDARWTRPVQFVGRYSLVYYTAHFPIMHFALVGLAAIGVTSSAVIAPVLFVTALVACTLLAIGSTRFAPISWLFKAPIPRVWVEGRPRSARTA